MIYIYDLEVLEYDWLAVFRSPESSGYTVIHNDNYKLKSFIQSVDNLILGGFNNKHYDDYILLAILNGADNHEVKRLNDYIIIDKELPWTYPFIQYKRKPFCSFDLRDDIPDKGLRLKAVEGNLYLPIIESSVPFNLDRPVTAAELEELIFYCKYDVDSTVLLYEARHDYIESKKTVGKMYGMDEAQAVGLTNAKLSARVLGAKRKNRDDEREYKIPDNIDVEDIPKPIYNFFMTIHDKTIPRDKLFKTKLDIIFNGCPCTYAWGGVHGAKPCYIAEASDEDLIVNFDVSSLYPSSMLNFGYVSRNCQESEAYKNIVATRLNAKHSGDKATASALKLVVNTAYGAMLEQFNGLYDPWAGRSVCITNQLAMTDLVVKLARSVPSFDIINFNTDGVMFHLKKADEPQALKVIDEWCQRTKFELERDDIQKIIQKDVNNYICIKSNGALKTKGGYVKLYDDKNFKAEQFKTASLRVIHRAIVDYLIKGITPEETINNTTNIFEFQQIAKTGSTYSGAVHVVNGQDIPIQKVNRIYASKDKNHGSIYKLKDNADGTVRRDKVADVPEHAIIDNNNKLTVEDIDKDFYIALAKKRIDDYLIPKKERKKNVEVINIMATTKKETVITDYSTLNLFQKLEIARKMFAEKKIEKGGVNRYAKFKYFRLEDVIPVKTEIFNEVGLCDVISFMPDMAALMLINTDNPDEHTEFTSTIAVDESMISNPIQKLGAVQTYLRRYLYLNMLDIVEPDLVDEISGQEEPPKIKKSNKPATTEERKEAKEKLTDPDGGASETQTKAIKAGLKKLREKDPDAEDYILESINRLKSGLSKTEAEDLLIEIGEKVAF